jgi:hypothetical protein
MSLRTLLIPAAIMAALAVGFAETAEAAPFGSGVSAKAGMVFGPRIYVGGHLGVPVGHRGGYYRNVVTYTGGYYVTRTRQVQVPGEQIGWDFRGEPIYAGSRTELQTYRVWVPKRRIVQRVWVPVRHRGYVTIGGRFRIR